MSEEVAGSVSLHWEKLWQPVSPVRSWDASPVISLVFRAGGLDDTLHTIIDYACDQNIPFVFALNRKALGRSLNKAVPVSVVGIFSYDGAQVRRGGGSGLSCPGRESGGTVVVCTSLAE